MKAIAVLASLLLASLAIAAPPYDVEVEVTAPASGGVVEGYVLYLDGIEVGPVNEGGNVFPGLLTEESTYTFEVAAVNSAGETRSEPVTVDTRLPGQPSIRVTISFAVE